MMIMANISLHIVQKATLNIDKKQNLNMGTHMDAGVLPP